MADLVFRETASGIKLQIGLGTELFIQMDGAELRLKTTLVGLEMGQYLLVRYPKGTGIDPGIFIGNKVRAIVMYSGAVYGFRTFILNHVKNPAPLLFLAHPKAIERRELRRHERIECRLPAIARIDGEDAAHRGVIADISTGGCKFISRMCVNLCPLPIKTGDKVCLACELLGIKDEESVMGTVRTQLEDQQALVLGIEFDQSNAAVLHPIDIYVRRVIEYIGE
jgi:c-di-GMP-binding flagellar brake protein YcgR